jgi:predicted  nucleic acid-binding Zn-ribbon protein
MEMERLAAENAEQREVISFLVEQQQQEHRRQGPDPSLDTDAAMDMFDATADSDAAAAARLEQLQSEVAQLRESDADVRARFEELRDKYHSVKQQARENFSAGVAFRERATALRTDLDEAERRFAELRTAAKAQLAESGRRARQAHQDADAVRAELAAAQDYAEGLRGRVNDLEAELASERLARQTVEGERAVLRRSVARGSTEGAQASAAADEAQIVARATEAVARVQQQYRGVLIAAKQRIQELEGALSAAGVSA